MHLLLFFNLINYTVLKKVLQTRVSNIFVIKILITNYLTLHSTQHILIKDTMHYIVRMVNMARDTQLLKGILEGCVLVIFKQEDCYGYRVVEKLQACGLKDIQEATVYPLLNRLEKKGLLSFEKKTAGNGPPRKYYSLTELGKVFLNEFCESWKSIKNVVQKSFVEFEEM
jgi:PadR family transcriptional regulator, regulatory protein PadR